MNEPNDPQPQPPGNPLRAFEDDDIVIRAFEEHARSEAAEPRPASTPAFRPGPPPPEAFEPLLGPDGADLVDEVSVAPISPFAAGAFPSWAGSAAVPLAELPPEVAALQDEQPPTYSWDDPNVPDEAVLSMAGYGEAAPQAQKGARTKTLIRELVETGLLALLVFLAVRASFQNFKVDGSSMSPTLHNGQFLIVNKLIYAEVNIDKLSNFLPFLDAGSTPKRYVFHGPDRGDIIVLQDPRKPDTDLIKRVIGLPGDTIEIVTGQVYINGFRLDEPYIKMAWHNNNPKVTIPAGEYFVMGDNRDNSLDSRSSSVGLVPKDLIIGKTMLSYWPREQFGLAPNESPRITNESISAAIPSPPPTAVKTGN